MQAQGGNPQLPPLGEVALHGAACGVRWRRLPRLTEAQLRELLQLGEGREEEGNGGRRGANESVPLHARLDGRLVPTRPPLPSSNPPGPAGPSASSAGAAAAARLDRAHAAVVDNFVSEEGRAELLSLVVFGGGDPGAGDGGRRRRYDERSGSEGLPKPRWERRTADSAEAAADAALEGGEEGGGAGGGGERARRRLGWGLSSAAIEDLLALASPSPALPAPRALAEVGSKLGAMFPEHDCLWLPTESMEGAGDGGGREGGEGGSGRAERAQGDLGGGGGGEAPPLPSSTSPPLLANAASSLDAFSYHVDCDPDSTRPGTPWHAAFGSYANGDPDRPLLVSVVLYLNETWSPSLAGETLVVDSTAAVGCAVLPRPRRALLLESDVLHKVCPPSSGGGSLGGGGGRLRFSLVLKLALCPKKKRERDSPSGNVNVLSREWWGPPADFGSAKALSELVRRVGEEKRKKRGRGEGVGEGEGKEEEEEGNGKRRAKT